MRIYDTGGATARNIKEDPKRCIEELTESGGWHQYQCRRKRVVGLYCKQHAKKHADPIVGWDIDT